MLGVVAAAMVLGAAATKPAPLKLASMGFASLNVPENAAKYYADHFAQHLTLAGLRVITASEIATLLGLERQKQLLGCSDNATSCMAELANALGVDGVVTGNLGRFGNTYQVNIKILAPGDGRPLSAYSKRVVGEESLLDEYERAGRRIHWELSGRKGTFSEALPVAVPVAEVTQSHRPTGSAAKRLAWIPASTGLLLVAGGSFCFLQSRAKWNELSNPGPGLSLDDAMKLKESGSGLQMLALVGTGLGAAALVTSGLMYFLSGESQPPIQPTLAAAPGTIAVGLTGVLP